MRWSRSGRVIYGVTAPITAQSFLRGQLTRMSEVGWEVHLLCGEPGAEDFGRSEGVAAVHLVPAARQPTPRDPLTLLHLWWLLVRLRPEVVVMGTPKMGVFGTVAAFLACVPRRVYLIHGYRGEALSGLLGQIMRILERIGCLAASEVVVVSESLREKLLAERVVSPAKVHVLGSGSANGVNLEMFRPPAGNERQEARQALHIPPDAQVVSYVGRLTADKGLQELPEIWRQIATTMPDAWLVIAGTSELTGQGDRRAMKTLEETPRVRLLGHVDDVRQVYRGSDLLLLLSHREGLGMVALEAGACGVPTVGWKATGVIDAVLDGETGVLVDQGDNDALVRSITALLRDETARRRLGSSAGRRVRDQFDQTDVWDRWVDLLAQPQLRATRNGVPS